MLPHPPQELDYRCQGYGDFVLSVNRLDRAKRIDLLSRRRRATLGSRWSSRGTGPIASASSASRTIAGLNGRARFTGRVSERELADLYARCLAVYYAPVDEDYGMVPLEAFLSEKPVLTTTDAGGPLEVVSDHATGLVVTPDAEEIARALGWLREHRDEAASFGRAGKAIAREVTWDRAIGRLLA